MFKDKFTFEDRRLEVERVLNKHPDKIPIVCEKSLYQSYLPNIDKHKYLVPLDYTIGQFIFIIRKRLKLNPQEALFLIIGNNLLPSSLSIGQIYDLYKDLDGFLYIQYAKENTFGALDTRCS